MQTSWMYQPDGPAGHTSWTNQLDGPAGQTSSFYMKPWPVRIFEDFPLSLYSVAASESDESLVFTLSSYGMSTSCPEIQLPDYNMHNFFLVLLVMPNTTDWSIIIGHSGHQ